MKTINRKKLEDMNGAIPLQEYEKEIVDTDLFFKENKEDITPILLGLYGEVGSIMSASKKYHREKKAYVGYTATPFANIFIHNQGQTTEEGLDLFPKDYIIDLPIPSNHSGLEKISFRDDIPFWVAIGYKK